MIQDPEAPLLLPGDIFLTRGDSPLSRAIRFFSRGFGESRTMVNHVGIVVEEGTVERAVVIEALRTVKKHLLWKRYGPSGRNQVAVYRPINLSKDEIVTVVESAHRYVGRTYGYLKIAAHFLDWLLFGVYLFRRFAWMDNYPICSWLVTHAFASAGKTFGLPPGAANPDDIWDFVNGNPDKYELVLPLDFLQNSYG